MDRRDGVGRARARSVWLMKDWHQQVGRRLPSSQIGSRAPTGQHQGTWGVTAGSSREFTAHLTFPSWEDGGFSPCGNLSVASHMCCLEHAMASHFLSHTPLCKGGQDPSVWRSP